jgi:hypothetical protein
MRRMRFACSITKATDTHSEYVKRIAFLRQKWLGKRTSTLRDSILSLSLLTAYFSFLKFHAILRHHIYLSFLLYVRSSSHVLTNEPLSYSNLGPPVSIIPCCLVRYANELVVLFRWVVSWAVRPRDSANLKTWRQYNIIILHFTALGPDAPSGDNVCAVRCRCDWLQTAHTKNCLATQQLLNIHGTRTFLSVSTKSHHRTLQWVILIQSTQIPLAVRPKAQASDRSVAGIVGSNPDDGTYFLLLCLLCVVWVVVPVTSWSLIQRSPTVRMSDCIWSRNLDNEAT